jgi:hypothetical protein
MKVDLSRRSPEKLPIRDTADRSCFHHSNLETPSNYLENKLLVSKNAFRQRSPRNRRIFAELLPHTEQF